MKELSHFFGFRCVVAFTLCFLLLKVQDAFCQKEIEPLNNLQEKLLVHANSSFFLIGETILFNVQSVIITSNLSSTVSSVAHVQLVDETGQLVLQTKIALSEGKGSGDFFIPSSLSTGNYTLIAYTNWMRNFSIENFFQMQVTIINPFRKYPGATSQDNQKNKINLTSNPVIDSSSLEISIDKKQFMPRAKVQIKISSKNPLPSNLSISVRQINPEIISSFVHRAKHVDSKPFNSILWQPKYLPELRGNLLTGMVKRKVQGQPVPEEIVYLSIPSKNYFFFASLTDSSGRFYFNLSGIHQPEEAIFQIDSTSCSNCEVVFEKQELENYSFFRSAPLKIDSSLKKIIEERSVLSQIENAYYEQKQDSIIEAISTLPFFGKPDISYKLDDYVRFPTMKDVFVEYISEIVVKSKGNKSVIKVKNQRTNEVFEKGPLILIDGIPILDDNQLMSYNPLIVEKIDVVGKRYFYGPLDVYGIVSITTNDGSGKNLPPMKTLKYIGIQPNKKYFSPDYTTKSEGKDRTPDNRIQLYWNPNLTVSNQSKEISFFTSDVAGDFEIVIEGLRSDGKEIYCRKTISVHN